VRVFGEEGASLLKVGIALMALAVGLVIAAVVVSVALRSEPERVVAADVAAKSLDHPLRYSSGEEGGAARKSSSEKEEPPPYPSGEEEAVRYGSSSSGGSVGQREEGQREEEAKEPQAVAGTSEPEPLESQAAMPQPVGRQTPSEAHSETEPSEPEPQPQQHQPQPEEVQSQPEQQLLPGEGSGWAEPTPQELEEANSPRHYGGLVDGAIMALTIEDIGIYNAPVYDSDSYWALANGIGHNPQTSLPWSSTPQRNVYLSGHRMGFRGTWSRMIFYNLDKLGKGERVVLEDREGRTYEYEVSEVFLAEPTDVWVMGQVRGRDMVTLQTCTPIPTFEKRLIVRADRV
jgi:sortase A